jgi:hypothetical protein
MISPAELFPIVRPIVDLWRKHINHHRITIEATSYPYYEGDFPFDMDPELYWSARVTVRHIAGRPVTLESIHYETYRTFLPRWLWSPTLTKHIRLKKFPHRLEEGDIHTFRVTLHAPQLAEIASHGKLWIAVTYSASRRPLMARFKTHELSLQEHQELWDSYDSGGNEEAQEEYYDTLGRIERKREEQKDFFKW